MKVEFIICTESGRLEELSMFLVFSIRNFIGDIGNSAIYSYKPRKGPDLSKKTIDFFEKNEVTIIDEVLNKDYINYPLANKPIVCSHRERYSNASFLIFLDSDTFFTNKMDLFDRMPIDDLYLRAVDNLNMGSNLNFQSKNGEYWKNLYTTIGVKDLKEINTTIDNRKVLEYYNSGMIVLKNNSGLFSRWLENFEKVFNNENMHKNGSFYIEQTVLSATISQMKMKVKLLNRYYNCPLHTIDRSQNDDYQVDDFSKLIHVHYHKIFHNKNASNPFYERFDGMENGKVINEKLIEFGVLKKKPMATIIKEGIKRRIKI